MLDDGICRTRLPPAGGAGRIRMSPVGAPPEAVASTLRIGGPVAVTLTIALADDRTPPLRTLLIPTLALLTARRHVGRDLVRVPVRMGIVTPGLLLPVSDHVTGFVVVPERPLPGAPLRLVHVALRAPLSLVPLLIIYSII